MDRKNLQDLQIDNVFVAFTQLLRLYSRWNRVLHKNYRNAFAFPTKACMDCSWHCKIGAAHAASLDKRGCLARFFDIFPPTVNKSRYSLRLNLGLRTVISTRVVIGREGSHRSRKSLPSIVWIENRPFCWVASSYTSINVIFWSEQQQNRTCFGYLVHVLFCTACITHNSFKPQSTPKSTEPQWRTFDWLFRPGWVNSRSLVGKIQSFSVIFLTCNFGDLTQMWTITLADKRFYRL